VTRLLVVLGGARSGKSAYAERRAAAAGASVLYIGTLLRGDDPDIATRIASHRARRPPQWTTAEVDRAGDVSAMVRDHPRHDAVLVDGFELALSLAEPHDDEEAASVARSTGRACREAARTLACVVSSEVGLGVVPATASGVAFRDRVGAANQALTALADEVVLVVAGLPLWLRGAG
jgi:adenosylcobinamide kinase / adenosylcobinamide-phosphate guanylyltransferase